MASLEALAGFDHIQEVILQNFVPHRRYYGEEPAEIATEAAERYWRTGIGRRAATTTVPAWANEVTIADMKRLVAETRRLMPEVGIQIPPNLADWWPELVQRGRDRPRRAERQRRPHLARAPVPVARSRCARGCGRRRRALRAPVRLPAVHRRGVAGAARARGDPRPAPARSCRAAATARVAPRHDRARPRRRARSTAEELTAMFSESRPEVVEDMRQAADELRAELAGDLVTFVVNRNINVSNVCTVGCAFCGFGVSKRSPDAYEHDRGGLRAPRPRGASTSARPRSACSRASTPTGGSRTTSAGCGWPRRPRRRSTCTPTARWRSRTCATSPGCRPHEVFAQLREAGLDSIARHRRRGAARRRARSGSARTSCPSRAGWRSSTAAHEIGLRSTVTVMFGHIETARTSWPSTCASCARCRSARAASPSSCRCSFIPFQTLLGRTHGIARDLARGEPQAHRGRSGSRSGARSRRCRRAGSRWASTPPPRRCAGASTTSAGR